jgi:putative membrane protein
MNLLFHLRVAVVGFIMGAADLVPGVSGGTIAFVSGIYDRLINGIKSFDLVSLRLLVRGRFREVWERIPVLFFCALGLGLLTAIFSLSRVLTGLMVTHPVQLWAFFFGLVLGSILLLMRETWRWRAADWTAFIVAAVITYWLVGLEAVQTPPSPLFLFLAGAIAICAMILPGISGSYLLVIMGKYHQVLEAVNHRDFASLAIFISGIVVGILSFVRLVSWLLLRWRHVTLVALTGVMAGALRTVWPWKEVISTRLNSKGEEVPLVQINVLPDTTGEIGLCLVLALLGAVVVVLLSRLSPDHRHSSVKPT